jgi:adenylate cyclase
VNDPTSGVVSSPDPAESFGLLDGLHGGARRDRAELVAWLLDRGFTVEQIQESLAPMMLPVNRLLGDDGAYVSAREISESTGVELELLEKLQRAVGLPRIQDPDAAVLPRADAEAAARAGLFVDFTVDDDDAVAVVRVMMDGLRRTAAVMGEMGYLVLEPGASEVELAKATEELARRAIPRLGPIMEGLLLLQLRQIFETQGVGAAERAAGELPGARRVAVAFADLTGFTRLGEDLSPEDLARLAGRLADVTHEIVTPPVWFIKTIGDAVMLVSPEPALLIKTVLELIDVASNTGLPQLRAGVAAGHAASRAGDWFGSPVNVASRVAGVASPGEVLVAESAREFADAGDLFMWTAVGPHQLKGLPGPVQLYRVTVASPYCPAPGSATPAPDRPELTPG